nr:MAG TPA: hypothetical protein [Ackermannviridae sp.]
MHIKINSLRNRFLLFFNTVAKIRKIYLTPKSIKYFNINLINNIGG